jgi:hypothetical protein
LIALTWGIMKLLKCKLCSGEVDIIGNYKK